MKILFHLNSMGRGGAERVVSILSDRFATEGNEVVIATLWESENEYQLNPSVKRIHAGLTEADEQKSRLQKAFLRLIRVREAIKKEKPDLIISFCFGPNFRAAYASIGMHIPLLVSVRNDPKIDYVSSKLSTWWMCKKAAGCVFQTSEAMAFFPKKFAKKGTIILNPLSEKYLDCEEAITMKTREKTIVNVGRISKQKNQQLLLEAFHAIHADFPEYVLKIYGDMQMAEIKDKMDSYISEHHLEDFVRFMGTTDQMREEIENTQLFVLSSDYEGMPNALIEAMVMGIPCISTDCPCGGPRELIEDGKNGKLVSVGDKEALEKSIREMLADTGYAETLGNQARKLKERVHPDKICNEWLAYIEKIMN